VSETEIVDPAVTDEDETTEEATGQTAADIGQDAARAAWAEAAREVLIEVAGKYHAVISHQDLAAEVQARSGVTTTQRSQHWIGHVLARVSAECAERGEPFLSSLCINTGGSVGEGYAVAVQTHTGETPADPDAHAARQRLACHQYFEAADLPADGGGHTLTAKLRAARTRSRKAEREARPIPTCPVCNMALPATGECDNCA